MIFLLLFVGVTIGFGIWLWIQTNGDTQPVSLANPLPHAFKNNPGGMVWLVTLVAFCTGALVQMLKELLPIRYYYHRAAVRKWIDARVVWSLDLERRAIRDLELLAAGEDEAKRSEASYSTVEDEFYHLPTEQMMGQISSAAEMAVSEPESHLALFLALAAPQATIGEDFEGRDYSSYSELSPAMRYLVLCGVKPAQKYFVKADVTKPVGADAAGVQSTELKDLFDRLRETVATEAERERLDRLFREVLQVREEGNEEQTERARLRADVMVNIHRALDGLQVYLMRGWRRRLTRLCFVTSAVISIIVVPLVSSFQSTGNVEDGIRFSTILFGIGFCWLAGTLFAPLAHDVMSAARRFRR